MKVIIWF